MKKRLLTAIPVLLVVFLCSFPAYAVTGGGKTIVSNSYSYNNGDVTVYVRVNGIAAEELYEGQHYYPHNFTVTLANNTNEFQVADASNFSIDLYSGSATAFASNQNSWGAEVTSYSNNMTAPRITMYPTGDLAGHVLVAFNDSDLLVLNPNETRTYNFSINFIQTENINYTPLNGNFRYSYFTYTGTVGFYARPTSFTSNTIDDFLTNESLPNSVMAWLIAQYEQGNITNQELSDIFDVIQYTGSYAPYSQTAYSVDTKYLTSSNVTICSFAYRSPSFVIDNDIYYNSDTDNYNANYSSMSYLNYYIYFYNQNDYDVSLTSDGYVTFNCNSYFSITDYFGDIDIFRNTNTVFRAYNIYIPAKSYAFVTVFGVIPYVGNTSTYTPYIGNGIAVTGSFSKYDPYNSFNVLEDDAHNQEMSYYSQTNTALSNTGLSNFSFSPNVIGGLGLVKDHFTYVWNKLGSYKDVYIFSMTLAIALMIIRHVRPIRRKKEE